MRPHWFVEMLVVISVKAGVSQWVLAFPTISLQMISKTAVVIVASNLQCSSLAPDVWS